MPGAPSGAALSEARLRQRVALLLLGAALAAPPSQVDRGPVLCPVRRTTGRRCPGCGATRSLVRLVHGDLRGATAAHPLGPALGLLLAVWAVGGERCAGTVADPRRWRPSPGVALGVGLLWGCWALRRARR